jgi:cell division protein FtsN
MKMSSLKFLSKILIIFISLIFTSCALQKSEESKIRIVDLGGKSHGVVTRTPPLNIQALEMQGMKRENNLGVKTQDLQQVNQSQKNEPQAPVEYGAPPFDLIQKTLQSGSNQNFQTGSVSGVQKQNPIVGTKEINNSSNNQKSVETEVEYDLATVEEDRKPEKKSNSKKSLKTALPQSSIKGLFVQVGSFSSLLRAEEKLQEMQKFHKGKIETVNGEKTFYRTLLGPLASKEKANQLMKKIKDSGREAVLLRNK